jgi:beta-glucosidase
MLKKIKFISLVFSIFLVFSGFQRENNGVFDSKINALIEQMTLEEKVNLLHAQSMFKNGNCERLGIPGLNLSDGPHGVREEISLTSFAPAGWTTDSSSYFPTGTAVAATWSKDLSFIQGKALGAEARARNKDVILGPGVNIHRTPLCGRNFEYLSEDPYLTAALCVPYINGIQENDVAACIKHYAVNNQELDRGDVDVYVSERALREIYLPAYKASIEKANVMTFMGAYNKLRGDWSCESSYLLDTLLRQEWGFKGLVMSDWSAVHTTEKAANAGLDLEMGTRKPFNEFYFADPLIKAVKDGEVSMDVINAKVRHILWVDFSTKLMGDTQSRAKGEFVTPAHSKVAYNVAKESVVLLKNERNVLPFNSEKIKSIAVIGDNAARKHAAGGASSGLKAKYEVTPLGGLKNRVSGNIVINYSLGYEKISRTRPHSWASDSIAPSQFNKDSLITEAVKTARKSDVVVIFAGLNHDLDTEGRDKRNMDLPYAQVELINAVAKVNPNTVVVIIAGSPVDFRGIINNVPSILWGWYNGMEGGNALADIILGKVNPSGKMPFTLPDSLGQSPAHFLGNYHDKSTPLVYEEDLLVGYRWFDAKKMKPAFPFGHGLSYTNFTYSNIELKSTAESVTVSFQLQNSGSIKGAETAQLYISAPGKEALRAPLELKGFEKVELAPGEKRAITIVVDKKDLAWYNDKIRNWQIEKGVYKMQIGSSSRDIRLSKEIAIN